MARSLVVDAGFLVALFSRRDGHHAWAAAQAAALPPPWHSCESVLSEAFHLLGPAGTPLLAELLQRGAVSADFNLQDHLTPVVSLLKKYEDVPMSLADACVVRLSETLPDPLVLTTDEDFRIYRRSGRQVIPCLRP